MNLAIDHTGLWFVSRGEDGGVRGVHFREKKNRDRRKNNGGHTQAPVAETLDERAAEDWAHRRSDHEHRRSAGERPGCRVELREHAEGEGMAENHHCGEEDRGRGVSRKAAAKGNAERDEGLYDRSNEQNRVR